MTVTAATFAWQDFAVCGGLPPDLFVGPEAETWHEKTERETAAKAVCAGCPVDRECLQYAVTRNIKHGVWGALGEDERETYRLNLRRRMRAAEGATS